MGDDHTATEFDASAALSHPGQRDNNEDCIRVESGERLLVVADGVGGYDAGEVASQIACDVVVAQIQQGASLENAVREADLAIQAAQSASTGRQGMASTIVVARISSRGIELAWVGDSRAYIWDGEALLLATRDHSLVAELIAAGVIDWAKAPSHPRRNVILQALGKRGEAELSVSCAEIQGAPQSAVLMLCTDGLSDAVSAGELSQILGKAREHTLASTAEQLVNAALEAGGRDNISVALCRTSAWEAVTADIPLEQVVWRYNERDGAYETASQS